LHREKTFSSHLFLLEFFVPLLNSPFFTKDSLDGHITHGLKQWDIPLQYMDNDEGLMTCNNRAFGIFPLKFTTTNGNVFSMDVNVNDCLEYDHYTFVKE